MVKLSYDVVLKITGFAMTGVISLATLSFCFYKLAHGEISPVWVGLMSSIIGVYIPSPVNLLTSLNVSSSDTVQNTTNSPTVSLSNVETV
jgi:hypothetical protein